MYIYLGLISDILNAIDEQLNVEDNFYDVSLIEDSLDENEDLDLELVRMIKKVYKDIEDDRKDTVIKESVNRTIANEYDKIMRSLL